MKKYCFLIVGVLFFGISSGQIANIPDTNFKNALIVQGYDTNNNEEIELSEVQVIDSLDVSDYEINDLSGIQLFTNLISLNCSNNSFESLNLIGLSNLKYLYCSYSFSPLTSINLNGVINLEEINVSGNSFTSLDFSNNLLLKKIWCEDSGFLNNININNNIFLSELYCFNSNLITLDISNNPVLTILNCEMNQLISLDITNNSMLTILNCGQNQLDSLNTNNNTFLKEIYCYSNQLTSLDFTNSLLINHVDCSDNQLSFLNVSHNLELSSLNCNINQLDNLDLSGLKNLEYLTCSENLFTGINLNYNNSLSFIGCSNNNLLTSLNLKNGSLESQIYFPDCPNLQYICADDNQTEEIQSLITEYGYTNCHVNSYCSFEPGGISNTIQGNVKYDNEFDGCDDSDVVFPNIKFLITDGINSGYAIADSSGNYELPVLPGTHIITPIFENPESFIITPQTIEVTFPDATSPVIQNFCITAVPVNDLEITLLPLNNARPGFNSDYKIVYKNKGNQTQSGNINFSFSDNVADYVTANPLNTGQVINSLSWNFSNLQPFETREILVTFNLNSPMESPPLNGNDVLIFTATVVGLTDQTPIDNISKIYQTVVNSFDPNDKTCLEGSTITPSQVGKEVHYMIRFENTGTANAQNIVVKDMIDTAKFDINSLIPINGSHSFVTRITETNKVEFIFENIQLPPFDDANNDGYVAFKIKTKPTLVLGNTFSNTASIYFDYNFPIITNTATTTVSNVLASQDFKFDNYISINPNPAKETLTINKQNIEISSISIYNTLGQLVQVIPNAKEIKTIDVSQLKSGNYFIKVVSDKGTSSSKFIKE